jgi:hypothetical protein
MALLEDMYSSSVRRAASVRDMLPNVAGCTVSQWIFISTGYKFPYKSGMF